MSGYEDGVREISNATIAATLYSEALARLVVARDFGIDLAGEWTEHGPRLRDDTEAAVNAKVASLMRNHSAIDALDREAMRGRSLFTHDDPIDPDRARAVADAAIEGLATQCLQMYQHPSGPTLLCVIRSNVPHDVHQSELPNGSRVYWNRVTSEEAMR